MKATGYKKEEGGEEGKTQEEEEQKGPRTRAGGRGAKGARKECYKRGRNTEQKATKEKEEARERKD